MTKEEIMEMAIQAGFVDYELDDGTTNAFDKRYEVFAKLVAEKERIACANIADAYVDGLERNYSEIIAEKIIARGKE
jgi:hypothetical protein